MQCWAKVVCLLNGGGLDVNWWRKQLCQKSVKINLSVWSRQSHTEKGARGRRDFHWIGWGTHLGRRRLAGASGCLMTNMNKGLLCVMNCHFSYQRPKSQDKTGFWVMIWAILRQFSLLFPYIRCNQTEWQCAHQATLCIKVGLPPQEHLKPLFNCCCATNVMLNYEKGEAR